MLRWFLYMLGSIFVIALLRGIIGIVTKGVAQLFEEEAASNPSGQKRGSETVGGQLVKCPACGIYFAPGKGVKKSLQGSTLVFCSENCRAKLS
jgi:hypothetical protein